MKELAQQKCVACHSPKPTLSDAQALEFTNEVGAAQKKSILLRY